MAVSLRTNWLDCSVCSLCSRCTAVRAQVRFDKVEIRGVPILHMVYWFIFLSLILYMDYALVTWYLHSQLYAGASTYELFYYIIINRTQHLCP